METTAAFAIGALESRMKPDLEASNFSDFREGPNARAEEFQATKYSFVTQKRRYGDGHDVVNSRCLLLLNSDCSHAQALPDRLIRRPTSFDTRVLAATILYASITGSDLWSGVGG
jgi:hypothetical protein